MIRARLSLALACVAMLASAGASARANPAPDCLVPAGIERDFQPGRLLLLGELHGTVEAPAAFGAAVCDALAHGLAVSAGLELNRDQTAPLAAYLASDGGQAAIASLLRTPFWTRAAQDGRSSAAMLALVERLRVLKRRYPALEVFALEDDAGLPEDAATWTRDRRMAARIGFEHMRRPRALVLTLSGNVHNRLRQVDAGSPLPQPMGSYLLDLAPRSLDLGRTGGSAWVCAPRCGVIEFTGPRVMASYTAQPYRDLPDGDAYTGQWSIGPTHASPPAYQQARVEHANPAKQWTPAWTAVPDSPGPALGPLTIRQVVRTAIGGAGVRIRLSNAYGTAPLTIGPAHLALHAQDARILPDTDHLLRFAGAQTVTIAPGASALADPLDIDLPALSELAISLYLPSGAAVPTLHGTGMQTAWLAPGDLGAAHDLPGAQRDDSRYFLAEVDVARSDEAPVLVVMGDSITDGVGSGNDNNARWTDLLAQRLQGKRAGAPVAVVNAGIAGNRLLRDAAAPFVGPSGLARFERDVLDQPGLRWVLLHEGINDIAAAQILPDPRQHATAAQVIEGMQTLAMRARARGVAVWAGTLLPFAGTKGFYTDAAEAERQAVNAWIRHADVFDGVIDFDLEMREPADPHRLRPELDSGDHLHPNREGYRVMAEAVDARMFEAALPPPAP